MGLGLGFLRFQGCRTSWESSFGHAVCCKTCSPNTSVGKPSANYIRHFESRFVNASCSYFQNGRMLVLIACKFRYSTLHDRSQVQAFAQAGSLQFAPPERAEAAAARAAPRAGPGVG